MHTRPFTEVAKEPPVPTEKCTAATYRGPWPNGPRKNNTPGFNFKLNSIGYEDGDRPGGGVGRAESGKWGTGGVKYTHTCAFRGQNLLFVPQVEFDKWSLSTEGKSAQQEGLKRIRHPSEKRLEYWLRGSQQRLLCRTSSSVNAGCSPLGVTEIPALPPSPWAFSRETPMPWV